MTEVEFFEMMPGYHKFFDEHGIKYIDYNLGFSEDEQQWYGWSHRAIYGFGIGSKVEPGHCGYIADNPEEMIDNYANFFADISQECADQHRAECQILPDRSGIRILYAPLMVPMANSPEEALESLEDNAVELPMVDIYEDKFSEMKCGRGTWTAETMADAKQMALDFAKGVS